MLFFLKYIRAHTFCYLTSSFSFFHPFSTTTTEVKKMGLGGISWLKKLLREDPHLQKCMHYASYGKMRNGHNSGPGEETGFTVVMVELMLRKHALIKGCRHLEDFSKKWRNLATEQIRRFPDAHTFIFLFDDETNVPRAKGKTQAKRRKSAGDKLTEQELDALGPDYRYLCNANPVEFDRRVNNLFGAEANRKRVSPFEIFMIKHMRTAGMREDEFEFATRCIAAGAFANLGDHRRILIDRGVWRSSFERRLETDVHMGQDEPWSQVVRSFHHTPTNGDTQHILACARGEYDPITEGSSGRAWILMDKWGVRRIDAMDGEHVVGEADVKIPRYARLFAGEDVYVVCHDTDVLVVLLLAVKDWIPRKGKCPGRLFLDMTVHTDEKRKAPRNAPPGTSNPPPLRGVVDIIALWREMHRWFLREFPGTDNPVEVFCTLLVFMGTDYVENPKSMASGRLWKAFRDNEARKHLSDAVYVDGHLGAALPVDVETQALLGLTGFDKVSNAEQATLAMVRLLLRDVTAGTFCHPSQLKLGPRHCPRNRQRRHISFRESALVHFLTRAYYVAGPKDATTWPPRTWMQAGARRVGWQMGYWYGGDTILGRRYFDEMAVNEQGVSIFGWHWIPDPDADPPVTIHTHVDSGCQQHHACQQRAGCLRRHRPHHYVSESAATVVPVRELHAFLAAARKAAVS